MTVPPPVFLGGGTVYSRSVVVIRSSLVVAADSLILRLWSAVLLSRKGSSKGNRLPLPLKFVQPANRRQAERHSSYRPPSASYPSPIRDACTARTEAVGRSFEGGAKPRPHTLEFTDRPASSHFHHKRIRNQNLLISVKRSLNGQNCDGNGNDSLHAKNPLNRMREPSKTNSVFAVAERR